MIQKILSLKFFEAPIIYICGSGRKANALIEEMFPGNSNVIPYGSADGISTVMSSPNGSEPAIYILWVKRKNIGLLAHEAIHVASSILRDRGIDPDNSFGYEETLAYTVQNIFKLMEEE